MTSPAANAVIFDLDGTLADTLEDIADAMNHVLQQHGLPTHGYDRYRMLVGEGARRLVERASGDPASGMLHPDVDGLHAAFLAHYRDHMQVKTHPYPGIDRLLHALAARGTPMAVLSNKPDAATRAMVAALFGDIPFASVRGQRPGGPRKPDPQVAHALVEVLRQPPAAIALVGDTAIDMQTARAAGMQPLGVLWGFRDRTELIAHGAQALLARPEDLLGYVRG